MSSGSLACAACAISYPVQNGIPRLLSDRGKRDCAEALGEEHAAQMKEDYGRESLFWKIASLAKRIVSSEYVPGRNRIRSGILDIAARGGRVLEIGSGARRLAPGVVNLDIGPFPGVDVVGTAEQLPVADSSLDGIVMEVTVEHIRDVAAAARETVRALRPGGRLLVVAPFIFPFHGYPRDFWRFSHSGLRELFSGLVIEAEGPYEGPASMLVNLLTDIPAGMLFPSRGKSFFAAKGLTLLPIFWLKFADIALTRLPGARHYSATLYLDAVKR